MILFKDYSTEPKLEEFIETRVRRKDEDRVQFAAPIRNPETKTSYKTTKKGRK